MGVDLLDAVTSVHRAAARPVDAGEASWVATLRARMAHMHRALRAHVGEWEKPGGIFRVLEPSRPGFGRQARLLAREHVGLMGELQQLTHQLVGFAGSGAQERTPYVSVQTVARAEDLHRLAERVIAFCMEVSRHWEKEADLVIDTVIRGPDGARPGTATGFCLNGATAGLDRPLPKKGHHHLRADLRKESARRHVACYKSARPPVAWPVARLGRPLFAEEGVMETIAEPFDACLIDFEELTRAPAPNGLAQAGACLERLRLALMCHIGDAEAPRGLFAQVDATRPALLRQISELRAEHHELLERIAELERDLRPVSPSGEDAADAAAMNARLKQVAERLRHHRQRETDLVQETITTDLGAGD